MMFLPKTKRPHRTRSARSTLCRLSLEALEDRRLLASGAVDELPLALQSEGHATGLRTPTAAEQAAEVAWNREHVVITQQVLLNQLAIDRLNACQKSQGVKTIAYASDASISVDNVIIGQTASQMSANVAVTALASSPVTTLPPSVDNSELPYFPPIGDQGQLDSCVAFVATYYEATYMTAMARGWSETDAANLTNKFSPKWTYNLLNGGVNDGLPGLSGCFNVLIQNGAATLADVPYDSNFTQWVYDRPEVWEDAISYRMQQVGAVDNCDTEQGLANLKALLADGYLLVFGTSIASYGKYSLVQQDPNAASDPHVGEYICIMAKNTPHHEMTVVGYDDNIWVDLNENGQVDSGEKGALKIANSWGTGWGNEGFVWLSYDALRDQSAVSGGPSNSHRSGAFQDNTAYWITAYPSYTPTVLAQFTLQSAQRDQLQMSVGLGTVGAATPSAVWVPTALAWSGGRLGFDGNDYSGDPSAAPEGTFVLDFTDLGPQVGTAQTYFLGLCGTGTITQFELTGRFGCPITGCLTGTAPGNIPQTASGGDVYAFVSSTGIAPSAIDLQGSGIIVTPHSLKGSGGKTSVQFQVSNRGNATSGAFNVKFFLSNTATIGNDTAIPLLIDPSDPNYDPAEPTAYHISSLASQATLAGSVVLAMPANDPFKMNVIYYVGIVIDADDKVVECNESNNSNRGLGTDEAVVSYGLLDEDFNEGLPVSWTICDENGDGKSWRDDNPDNRWNAIATGNFVVCDASYFNANTFVGDSRRDFPVAMDESLITPYVDCRGYRSVVVEFSQSLMWDGNVDQIADVDVRVGDGPWVSIQEYCNQSLDGDIRLSLPVSVADQDRVQIRWHYRSFINGIWGESGDWGIDNVAVIGIPMFDTTPPISSVTLLPSAKNTPTFNVAWSGSDGTDGTGIASYDIFVSDNGGDYSRWLTAVTTTSATFSGLDGHRYAFFSVATDNAGNVEPTHTVADTQMLVDALAPTGCVVALARIQTTCSFSITVTGSDLLPGAGTAASGVQKYDVYQSTDGGAYSLWQTLLVGNPTTVFVGSSNHSYAFYAVAHDVAGNVEQKTPHVEAGTYVPDLASPATTVTTVNSATAAFTVNFQGNDTGGSGLAFINVYVQKDGGATTQIAHLTAEKPDAHGISSGSVAYQATADSQQHSYRFYTIGTDGAGNIETPSAGTTVAVVFGSPAALAIASFDVQHGSAGRSYIRYLDVSFNKTDGIQSLIDSIGTASSRIQLTHYDLNGQKGQAVSLVGDVRAVDKVMEFDFGTAGLGGNASSTAGDGYYELTFDLDGNGTFETVRHFYRLLGDVNGDRTVDNTDIAMITAGLGQYGTGFGIDVNGDGKVDATDRLLAMASRGRHLLSSLAIDR